MTKILITGGSGFIGTGLIKNLIQYRDTHKLDLEICAIDLMEPKMPTVKGIQGSILDITSISEAARGCDYVIHLAALLGVKNSEHRRLDCLNINILGTVNILNVCVQERVKRVILASSSEVYGDQITFPITESNPVNPKSVYGLSKLAAEEYVRAYHKRFDLNYTILRFFNVYGPGQVGEFVVPRFVMAMQKSESPVIYGDGEQKRAFCYVDDAAQGAIKALYSEKAKGEIFNIGNDKEIYSIKDVAAKAIKVSGKRNIEPEYVEITKTDRTPEREIYERFPDISKAKNILGYEPKVKLDEGLKKMFNYGDVVPTWGK